MPHFVNNYELLEQLGQGGMGVVYKARHINFNEIVAIKKLWEHHGSTDMVKNLFFDEGRILRKLNHKNIVQVTDLFEFEQNNYIVMEFIQGCSLHELIKNETGPIRRERSIALFKQMLEGMSFAHSQNTPIIHRHINPLNILVTSDDIAKITDFGIAEVLDVDEHARNVVKGKPVYMSPEQIIDPKSVDIRTDVYSLGMTFYEMLCGKTPFAGNTTTTPTAVYASIMNGDVPAPTHFYSEIPEALSDFVMKAVHMDRTERFTNANEMLRRLEQIENSGDSIFQFVPAFVPPVTNRVNSEKRNEEAGEHAVLDSNRLEPTDNPELESKESISTNRNNIWKWVAGLVVVVGLILGIALVDTTFFLTLEKQKAMILVEGGTFTMGSIDGGSHERPTHQVTVSSFMIGEYEVTQELWESVIEVNRSKFKGGKRPVDAVSWEDAIEFCNKLSEKEGFQKVYSGSLENLTCDFSAGGYRLPTEAEWEYAARGGNKSKGYEYSGSNDIDAVAWYGYKNSGKTTHEVGMKKPNELGIYDMSGNVWEWCWDWQGYFSPASQKDPRGPTSGSRRVMRGGDWEYHAVYNRVASRNEYGWTSSGFRLVRTKN